MDNETELSIEETNKLREKLGLKKLDVEDKHDKKKKKKCALKYDKPNENSKGGEATDGDTNVRNGEEGENVRKRNNRNKNKESIKGNVKSTKTISEEFSEDINDVEKWVSQTRNSMNKKLINEGGIKYSDDEEEEVGGEEAGEEEAGEEEAGEEEAGEEKVGEEKIGGKKKKNNNKKNSSSNENSSSAHINANTLASHVTVEHKNEDITDDMILTLKDQNILNNDEEKDYLINEDLKKKKAKSLVRKNDDSYWNKNYYNPLSYYEDTNKQNEEDNSSFRMLPKYDERKEEFDVTIKYDENDKERTSSRSQGIKGKGKDGKNAKNKSYRKMSELVGEEEQMKTQVQQNVDSNVFKLKKRKIQNISKRKKEEDAWAFLYDKPEVESLKGSGEAKSEEMKGESAKCQSWIDETREGSENIIKDVLRIIKEEQTNIDLEKYFDKELIENEEDKELYEMLQKENRLKRLKKGMDYQNELLKYIVINEEGRKPQEDMNNDVIKLSNASEFCKNISIPQDAHEIDNRLKMHKGGAGAEGGVQGAHVIRNDATFKLTYEQNDNLISMNNTQRGRKNFSKDVDKEDDNDEDNSGSKNMEVNDYAISHDGVSEIFNEIKLDQGLYGALEYLKTKGELNMDEKVYKNPENRPLHMSTSKHDIKLDYKNDSGKVMTPKETFRYISWIFHGKKQGKNKMEKKIKRMEIERRFKENPMESLPTLNVLKKVQQVHKKSYFTLSNSN
ncbi:hypothetical protein, conserved [Plasmodium gonderi]|uniref:U4/U6.U5 tri-snRNP-associated protein 1 n=1 Tax=Plasmodium gonderi TaxID=77519 RepID=A0A1Y1JH96_PLAGO|nr:hypothetical protein, conserved [Plasmodium gonderi]GAW80587.1 hypothetical protein, conserved [Plasmodium gonderi]